MRAVCVNSGVCVCVQCVCSAARADVTFIPHASRARLTEHIWAVPQVFSWRIPTEIDPKRVLTSVATLTFDPPAADHICGCGFTWFKNDGWNLKTAFKLQR